MYENYFWCRGIIPTFAPRSNVRPEGGFRFPGDKESELRIPFFPYSAHDGNALLLDDNLHLVCLYTSDVWPFSLKPLSQVVHFCSEAISLLHPYHSLWLICCVLFTLPSSLNLYGVACCGRDWALFNRQNSLCQWCGPSLSTSAKIFLRHARSLGLYNPLHWVRNAKHSWTNKWHALSTECKIARHPSHSCLGNEFCRWGSERVVSSPKSSSRLVYKSRRMAKEWVVACS